MSVIKIASVFLCIFCLFACSSRVEKEMAEWKLQMASWDLRIKQWEKRIETEMPSTILLQEYRLFRLEFSAFRTSFILWEIEHRYESPRTSSDNSDAEYFDTFSDMLLFIY